MDLEKARNRIKRELTELAERVKETPIIVVLLGAGNKGLKKRKSIKEILEREGVICLIPEEDFPKEVSPSIIEEAIFRKADVDLIFVNVESWGSATEFAQLVRIKEVAQKLRVLTHYKYHPLYGRSKSYLTDLYLTYMALYGHVYAYSNCGKTFPTDSEIIVTLAKRFREIKAMLT